MSRHIASEMLDAPPTGNAFNRSGKRVIKRAATIYGTHKSAIFEGLKLLKEKLKKRENNR